MEWSSRFLLLSLSWQGARISAETFDQLKHLAPDTLQEALLEKDDKRLTRVIQQNNNWQASAEKQLQWLVKNKVEVCYRDDLEYPKKFFQLDHPPLGFTYWGECCWRDLLGLSVVGSRNPHAWSVNWLQQELAQVLRQKSLVIISGGARGIDQSAHAVALKNQVPTIGFLPSGIANIYPSSFVSWVDAIVAGGGAVISQFSPFAPMYKGQFHARNRLIAALCDYLIVAEARLRSGSLLTAKLALDMGKPIGVVPCSPMMPSGRGGLDLIYDGADMLRDHRDVIDKLCDTYGLKSKLAEFSLVP